MAIRVGVLGGGVGVRVVGWGYGGWGGGCVLGVCNQELWQRAGKITSIMVRSLELALSQHCCNIVKFEVAA